jgi:sRNA-binding protein
MQVHLAAAFPPVPGAWGPVSVGVLQDLFEANSEVTDVQRPNMGGALNISTKNYEFFHFIGRGGSLSSTR